MESADQKIIYFPPFRLDVSNQCVWRGDRVIPLRPKSFELLRYLATRAGQLVTKNELLDSVWLESFVSDAVLKVSIGEVRKALEDESDAPRFIETVHRRGYRFIGKIGQPQSEFPLGPREFMPEQVQDPASSFSRDKSTQAYSCKSTKNLVGRAAALVRLERCLERALRGDRQVLFITGEPGIGKTTVVDVFLERCEATMSLSIARGQCLEQYGAGEAYMPVLEAFEQLCRKTGSEHLVSVMSQNAPTWLAQMPSLIGGTDREALRRSILGATTERMLREMTDAVEALTAKIPLLLVIEDLHWSDYLTLDLISSLARRRDPARLLFIGTYRPVEVILTQHPLKAVKQELQLHRRCEELLLEFLTEASVSQYLSSRLPGASFLEPFTRFIHQRTDGNPLFMVTIVDYLLASGLITKEQGDWQLKGNLEDIGLGVPESLRQMIERQIDRLNVEERQLLETASVVGPEFVSATVAAVLEVDLVQAEAHCEALARKGQFLRDHGIIVLPDGTMSPSFSFAHILYKDVLYHRLSGGRRLRLHRAVGEHLELTYGQKSPDIAAELAFHFEQCLDYRRAVEYLRLASQNAMDRYANRDAISYLNRALGWVDRLAMPESGLVKMDLLERRGLLYRSMGDMRSAAKDLNELAREARDKGYLDREVKALCHLSTALTWFDLERCLPTGELAVERCQGLNDRLLLAHAQGCLSYLRLLLQGWRHEDAYASAQAVEAARQAGDRALLTVHLGRYAYFQSLRSEYQACCQSAEEGLQLAFDSGNAFEYMLSHFFQAWALLHAGRWGELETILKKGIEMAGKNGHQLWTTLFHLELAWLHEQAFDNEGARELCEQALQAAPEARNGYTQLMATVLLGFAHLGNGQHASAFRCFSETVQRLEHEHILMEWIWKIPLHQGLGEYWYSQRELPLATQEAKNVCKMASLPGERTWGALGRDLLARVALEEKNWPLAGVELKRAFTLVDAGDTPLAEWRVYATAARFANEQGKKSESKRYRARSLSVLQKLADSMAGEDSLRHTFLASSHLPAKLSRKATAAS